MRKNDKAISLMELTDQIGRQLNFKSTPKRIISLVPSQTELLYDLGLENEIVGITKFCVHPKHLLKSKTIVGGTKQIKLDKIEALKADIILCNKEENTKEIVQACEQISVVYVSDIYTINDCLELISQYGDIFNKALEAKNISLKINQEQQNFKEFIKDKPVLKTAYFIWINPWMVAGNKTFINYLLQLNKFENVYANNERYPELDLSKQHQDLDLILLSSEPFPFKEEHKVELKQYFKKAKILLVDGEMFSWYGSRLIYAFNYFKELHAKV